MTQITFKILRAVKMACRIFRGMRRITTFRSTTDRIYDNGPIRLYYYIYHCVTVAYSIQYSNMLYRFVA